MNILLTGCAGFIGSNVARLLLESGHAVLGVDSLGDRTNQRLQEWRLAILEAQPRFAFRHIDISHYDALKDALKGGKTGHPASAVIHLAARAGVRASVEDPWSYYHANVLGTLNLLEACREYGVGKFLLASTSSVYGSGPGGPVTEDAQSSRPLSPYAASKKAAEALLYSYHHLHGINAVVLRYFTVYGPAGRPDMSVFRFIRDISEGNPIAIYGDGTQQRDYTYVSDVARGTMQALMLQGYETINLGHNRPVAVNDVVRLIEEAVGRPAIVRYEERHPADVATTWADNSRAQELLGWLPCVTIEEGIRRTVEWYIEQQEWARGLV